MVNDIKAKTQGGKITLLHLELDSLASIKAGAAEFLRQSSQLNVLVNNAGYVTSKPCF